MQFVHSSYWLNQGYVVTMLEVYSIGNGCMKTLSWKYTLMVREGLIYNDTVYMIFISFGTSKVDVTLFDIGISCYLLERLSEYLQTRR